MEIWEAEELELIGGTRVTVELVEVENWDDGPHMELVTRFSFPVEGKEELWGYALVLCDYLTGDYMLQEFRQEVARWERLTK